MSCVVKNHFFFLSLSISIDHWHRAGHNSKSKWVIYVAWRLQATEINTRKHTSCFTLTLNRSTGLDTGAVVVATVVNIIISLVRLKDMHCRWLFETNVFFLFFFLSLRIFVYVYYFVVFSLWLIVLSKRWYCLNTTARWRWPGWGVSVNVEMLMYKTGSQCVCVCLSVHKMLLYFGKCIRNV